MSNNKLYSTASLVLLALVFIGLVILSQHLFKGWRVDLTENQQYTLSDGTRNILAELSEPVTIYYFFSEEASRDLPQIRSYSRWVEELLDEMAERSNGQLSIRRVDPRPFSPEEDEAARFGLQSVPVGTAGDPLYFGLAGTNSVDDVQTIPFLQPSKEQFFEYDLAKMISQLSNPKQMKVGLLSSLDMAPGFDATTRQARPAWTLYEQMEQLFEIETVAPEANGLPSDLDLLMVVHPKELPESMRYAIDQFVLGGGRLMAFVDPFSESDVGGDPSDPMARLNAGSPSNLADLFAAWGVAYDESRVVGDALYALQVSVAAGTRPVRHLGILSVTREGLNQDDIVSADLESVNLSSAGWFVSTESADTNFQPLVQTSENAGPLDASRLRFLSNPADLAGDFQPTGDRYTMAARVTGSVRSAFEQQPEGHEGEHLTESGAEGINVILFADSDLLTDRMWVNKQNFFGQTIVNSFADNGTLVVNSVDNLLGSSDLISIRTRASSNRPFDRVDRLRLEAEGKYRATEERLNQELADTEQKLAEMQSARTEGDMTVFSDEQQAELDRFMDQRIQIRSDLRQVQHELDREIDSLGTRLKVMNIVVVPLILVAIALILGQIRTRRRREAAA